MATYTINTVDLAPTPGSSQLVTINYKLWNTPTWTTYGVNITVNTSGSLPIPAVITGLTSGQTYNIQVLGQCGSPIPMYQTNIIVP